ncbi:MAG: c-type cytochrome [Acidobacteriota bacterium]|jgi:mono/diheme cytochrome c family protein
MDFPVFHLDFFGNRLFFATIAVTHVFINHALAVGAMPVVTLLEWQGHRRGREDWDHLAHRILTVCFIVTTSLGALTGVGIWLSASLVNPRAIGSLIRVFFSAWFTEWIVFCLEVMAIMAYYLTWRSMRGGRKRAHIALGVGLSVFSWLTLAIIVAILGFMMDPGSWATKRSFLSGVFNPIYLPQLAFRTPIAMVAAGVSALFLTYFFTRKARPLRAEATRLLSVWVLAWLPVALAGAWWYRAEVPGVMLANVPVAVATQAFQGWYRTLLVLMVAMAGAVAIIAGWGALAPRRLPRVALLVPFVLVLALLGTFERVREFIRKPWVIGGYMYANGIRAAEVALLQEDGLLAHATYTPMRTITAANRVEAGREVFFLACTRCHTTTGVNSVLTKLQLLYGPGPWDRDVVKAFLKTMHNVRPYMPPFPGSDVEAGALADYLISLRTFPEPLAGAQSAGVTLPPPPTTSGQGGK